MENVDFIRSETKRFVYIFSVSLLFVVSLCSQNCQIILITGEKYFDLELTTFSGDTLGVKQSEGEFISLHVDDIQEIYIERKINMASYLKKILTGATVGVVIGSVSGLVFSELALKWLSNDENPKGWISNRNLSSGDEAIVNVFTGMSAILGLLHGYDWAEKKLKNIGHYDFSNKSKIEKKDIIDKMFRFQKETNIPGELLFF